MAEARRGMRAPKRSGKERCKLGAGYGEGRSRENEGYGGEGKGKWIGMG